MNNLINQSSQSIRTKYISLQLLSLVTLRKSKKLEAKKEEMKERWNEEKEYTRM